MTNLPLTPQIFNFGGDEVPSGTWEKSPVCARLRQSGISSDFKKYMVAQVANMTSMYNLDLAAWEDGVMSNGKPMRRELFPNRQCGFRFIFNFLTNSLFIVLINSGLIFLFFF